MHEFIISLVFILQGLVLFGTSCMYGIFYGYALRPENKGLRFALTSGLLIGCAFAAVIVFALILSPLGPIIWLFAGLFWLGFLSGYLTWYWIWE